MGRLGLFKNGKPVKLFKNIHQAATYCHRQPELKKISDSNKAYSLTPVSLLKWVLLKIIT